MKEKMRFEYEQSSGIKNMNICDCGSKEGGEVQSLLGGVWQGGKSLFPGEGLVC